MSTIAQQLAELCTLSSEVCHYEDRMRVLRDQVEGEEVMANYKRRARIAEIVADLDLSDITFASTGIRITSEWGLMFDRTFVVSTDVKPNFTETTHETRNNY